MLLSHPRVRMAELSSDDVDGSLAPTAQPERYRRRG
jgi:hypothetical protein